jgi:pimeloyl-ACP methyl ester carboxylesterase
LLSTDEYGIRTGGTSYPIPVTKESLLGLIEGPAFDVMRLDVAWRGDQADVPTLICLGENDPYLTVPPETMARAIAERAGSDVSLEVIPDSDHHFHGSESAMVERIIAWSAALPTRPHAGSTHLFDK